jgi:hypothetical protein
MSGLIKKRLAKCSHLWPFNSVRRSPFFASQRMILVSSPPLARTSCLPSKEQATVLTQSLPFFEQVSSSCRNWSTPPPVRRGVGVGKSVTVTVLPAKPEATRAASSVTEAKPLQ